MYTCFPFRRLFLFMLFGAHHPYLLVSYTVYRRGASIYIFDCSDLILFCKSLDMFLLPTKPLPLPFLLVSVHLSICCHPCSGPGVSHSTCLIFLQSSVLFSFLLFCVFIFTSIFTTYYSQLIPQFVIWFFFCLNYSIFVLKILTFRQVVVSSFSSIFEFSNTMFTLSKVSI